MMKTVLKFDLLIAIFLLMNLFIILSAMVAWAEGKKGKDKSCGEGAFTTEIIEIEEDGECYDVVLNVSFEDGVVFELSHANFDFGCGTYSEGQNSEGWPMVFNSKDPTTGLGGVKVDDIQNFGKDSNLQEFQVKFRFCPDQDCDFSAIDIAYKAGQCFYEESINTNFPDDNDGSGNNGNSGDGHDSGDTSGTGSGNTGDCDNPNNGSGGNPAELVVEVEKVDPNCNDQNSGSISLYVSGGAAPISIIWNTGNTTNTLSNLPAGIYSYTVTDALGTQVSNEIVLANSSDIVIESVLTKPDCQNTNNGAIELLVSGGTAPYSFVWSNGSTDQNLYDLYAYTYQVTVTDANGCSSSLIVPLYSATNIFVAADIVQPSCQDGTLGSIALTPSGGAEPYSFLWSDGQTSSALEGLGEGKYQVEITDQNGCTYSRDYSFITDVGIEVNAAVTKTNCLDEPVGSIDLTVSGGSEPYQVVWSNGTESEDLEGLKSGSYTATITDSKGCKTTFRTSVSKNDINIGYDKIVIPSCNGSNDGSINIGITNATEPYTINWINAVTGNSISNTQEINNISAGTYEVSVMDAAGCSAMKTIQLPEPSPIVVDYKMNTDDCTGIQGIVLEVSGGSWEYTYLWSDGSTGDRLNNAGPGTHTVQVIDSKGCTATREIIVEDIQTQELACLIEDTASDITCGSSNNVLSSSVPGALSYRWTIASTDGGWAISTASNQSQIEFKAGTAGSQAIVTLTVAYEGGCRVSCEKVISACIVDPNQDDNCCCNQEEENPDVAEVPDETGNEPGGQEDFCNECEGGVTFLNLDYLGDGPVNIVVSGEIKGKKGEKGKKERTAWEQVFADVNHGDILEIQTPSGAEKLGTRTFLTIDDGEPFEIHTSCSQDIAVGMVFGDYKVTDGASLKGGPFCDVVPSDDDIAQDGSTGEDNDDDQAGGCSECEGGVTYLNLDYLGEGPVNIVVTGEIKGAKGENGKKERKGWEQVFANVNNGDILEIQTPDGAEKLGTRTYLTIDEGEPFEIHTSCSQDIEVGMVFGHYQVVEGASLKGGQFCGVVPPDDVTADNVNSDQGSNDDPGDKEEDNEDDGDSKGESKDEHEVDDDIAEEGGSASDDGTLSDKSCDCFFADPVQITRLSKGYHYSIEVRYEDCQYDLSHLAIDIPDCYDIMDYSNSMDWAMELVSKDPTTGLSGLKVDNIPAFGKDENLSSFTIEFSLTAEDPSCHEELRCFTPAIAYKASTCVYEEITEGECAVEDDLAETVSTYPNPTTDYVKINMKNCNKNTSYKADIFDFRGERVCSYFIDKGFKDEFVVNLKYRKHGLYLLQLTRKDGARSMHKIVKL
jgi:hypothetical protein